MTRSENFEESGLHADRVARALAALRDDFERAVAEDKPLPKLSKSSLMKTYGIPRTSFYTCKFLVGKVEQAFEEMRRLAAEAKSAKKKPSITSLQAEVVALRKALKKQEATYASITIEELLVRCGPLFRDRQHTMLKYHECQRQNEELRLENANQAKRIKDLLRLANR